MWAEWAARWRRRQTLPHDPRVVAEAPPAPGRRMSGEYLALHAYLDGRFADTVVLSFVEIESLLGFSLPPVARSDAEWWTVTTSGRAAHQDAWRLAHRSVAPNLPLGVVTFDRQP